MSASGLDRRALLVTAAASAALAAPAAAEAQAPEVTPKPPAKSKETRGRERAMSTGGFSKARLDRMHDALAGHVARGQVPGLVTLVSRRGETHVDAIGVKALGGSDPMRRDTIFRIASMTKPITAAAAMILVEEAKLRLDDPVDRWLPELANRKVLRSIESPLDDTVPAKRADHAARPADLPAGHRRGDGVPRQISDPEGDAGRRRRARSDAGRPSRPTS